MSKKYNDQKLIIENFNKWINEEEKTDELDDLRIKNPSYMEEETEQEIDEGFFAGTMAAGIVVKKLGGAMMDLMRSYNNFTQITREIASAPESEVSPQVKGAAEAATKAVPTIPQQIINSILQKRLGLDIDVGPIGMPSLGGNSEPEEPAPESSPEPEPEDVAPEPEPEDDESRAKLGLMSKEKEDRLKQLRAKRRSKLKEDESNE